MSYDGQQWVSDSKLSDISEICTLQIIQYGNALRTLPNKHSSANILIAVFLLLVFAKTAVRSALLCTEISDFSLQNYLL